jgi:hypothetical protein
MMPVVKQTADLGQYFGFLTPIIPSKVLHEMINALWRRNFVTPLQFIEKSLRFHLEYDTFPSCFTVDSKIETHYRCFSLI